MVTLEHARHIIAAAEKKAKELGQPMNIAVADSGGNLVAHIGRARSSSAPRRPRKSPTWWCMSVRLRRPLPPGLH